MPKFIKADVITKVTESFDNAIARAEKQEAFDHGEGDAQKEYLDAWRARQIKRLEDVLAAAKSGTLSDAELGWFRVDSPSTPGNHWGSTRKQTSESLKTAKQRSLDFLNSLFTSDNGKSITLTNSQADRLGLTLPDALPR